MAQPPFQSHISEKCQYEGWQSSLLSWNLERRGLHSSESWPVCPEPPGTLCASQGFLPQSQVCTVSSIGSWLFQRQLLDLYMIVEGKWIGRRFWENRGRLGLHTCVLRCLLPIERWMEAWRQHPTRKFDTAPAAHTIGKRHGCRLSSKDSLLNHRAPKMLVAPLQEGGCRGQRLCKVLTLSCSSLEGRNKASFFFFLDPSCSLASFRGYKVT